MSSLWNGSCSNAINVLKWAPCCGHWDSVTKGMSRWWENACLDPVKEATGLPDGQVCVIYRGVLPQARIFRSFRWQGSVAVSSCNNFWEVKQICGCIQQVASTARRIMAGQRCFCQGKLPVPMLLSLCMSVHEQNTDKWQSLPVLCGLRECWGTGPLLGAIDNAWGYCHN